MIVDNPHFQKRDLPRHIFGGWLYGSKDRFPHGKTDKLPEFLKNNGFVRVGFTPNVNEILFNGCNCIIDGEVFKVTSYSTEDFRDHISGKQERIQGWMLHYLRTMVPQSKIQQSNLALTE
jgi:hypothetical protein